MSNRIESREDVNAYLRMVCDESLSEHDKKYHPGGYKEDDSCNKRANMEKEDPADTDIEKKKDTKAATEADKSEEEKKRAAHEAWKKRSKIYLQGIDTKALSELLHKYDDDKHPGEMEVIQEEISRRQNSGLNEYLKSLGERA